MEDRTMMENILAASKNACDLMMHGALESSAEDVHGAFVQSMNEHLCMQNSIYAMMSKKGWYPPQQAEQKQIDSVKTKFANKM